MGLTVLYLAFGIVALWLLGEVLLQYKARLRFRLLAFVGFLGVVLGVLMHSVVVIGLGAAAFTVGQTYVTLSFRQGFAQGWAINGRSAPAKPSKRRRGEPGGEDPSLEVSDLEAVEEAAYRREDDFAADDDVFTPAQSDRFMPPGSAEPAAAESTAVYEPQPLPEDTGSYGVYNAAAYAAATDQSYAGAAQSQDQQAYATTAQDQQGYATGGQSQDQQAYAYDGYTGYDQQQYGYDNSQQQYAAYSDPYIGQQTYTGASYDTTYTGGDQQYTQQQNYGQDQYATGTYGGETPAGGVWVPQQRTDEYGGELPPEQQQYPYQGNGNNSAGIDEQYRY
ncbi:MULTISPECIES: hypothetical protein [unclassified Streptomyces]|uniref:SCO2102 family sporulation regulator n=1 Tax=unclassified Streptomyces TaxID=2593676 RepID=UPI00224FED4F|nr:MULTISPECIES: hypothetical protein [unclassified Streptomyces]MCX4991512.1 hypothetical protein [Streptomyces sp. NBC_00568]MCX5003252.1 hypothetical protein [Streptomyces sp. NBC_00638]